MTYFQGGIRKISKEDYNNILNISLSHNLLSFWFTKISIRRNANASKLSANYDKNTSSVRRKDNQGWYCCVAGITSCFIATFVSVAASKGIKLTKLNVNTECMINFAKTFDVADESITEGIDFQIEAESTNADKQQLQELVKMAEERCPAMYSMKHEVKVNAVIIK